MRAPGGSSSGKDCTTPVLMVGASRKFWATARQAFSRSGDWAAAGPAGTARRSAANGRYLMGAPGIVFRRGNSATGQFVPAAFLPLRLFPPDFECKTGSGPQACPVLSNRSEGVLVQAMQWQDEAIIIGDRKSTRLNSRH